MAIEDHFHTSFTFDTKVEAKVGGRLSTSYAPEGNLYTGAFFQQATDKRVVFASTEYVIVKNLYCYVTVPISLGDIVTVDLVKYEVVSKLNTNDLGHHYKIGLATWNM